MTIREETEALERSPKGRKGREPQPKDGVVLNELGNAGEIDEAEVKGGQRHGLGRISNDACTKSATD